MFNMTLIRERLTDVLRDVNGGELNVYGWPDAQPEFPCVTFTWPTTINYHATQNRHVSELSLIVTVMVASADVSEATRRIDQYVTPVGPRSLVEVLEKADGQDAWNNLTVTSALNWRQNSDIDALAYDIEIRLIA